LIASIPFSALAFVSYPWLAAMISPLGALRWNRNLPAWSLLNSNLAAIDYSLALGVVRRHASNDAEQLLTFLAD
jgi:hypothetical protein